MSTVRMHDRQVGDTSTLAFDLTDGLTATAFTATVLESSSFWIEMVDADGASKITHAAMTVDTENSRVTYTPDSSEVDTAGNYRVQINGIDADGVQFVSQVLRLTLVANTRDLTFA